MRSNAAPGPRSTGSTGGQRTTAAPATERAMTWPAPPADPHAPGAVWGSDPTHQENCGNCSGTGMDPAGGVCRMCGGDTTVKVIGDTTGGAVQPSAGHPWADYIHPPPKP